MTEMVTRTIQGIPWWVAEKIHVYWTGPYACRCWPRKSLLKKQVSFYKPAAISLLTVHMVFLGKSTKHFQYAKILLECTVLVPSFLGVLYTERDTLIKFWRYNKVNLATLAFCATLARTQRKCHAGWASPSCSDTDSDLSEMIKIERVNCV